MTSTSSEQPGDFLAAGVCIESDRPEIRELAAAATSGAGDESEKARRLFYWVRDRIAYDVQSPFWSEEHYRAGATVKRGRGFCIQKAVLLAALARAVGIPARLVFADLRNRRMSPQLLEAMGGDLFIYHCYDELWLSGRWIKVVCSFDVELCRRHDYPPVEFDGERHALFAERDRLGRPFMEYVRHHGPRADVPLSEVLSAWHRAYGGEKVSMWRRVLEENQHY